MTKKDQLSELEYQYGFKDKDVSIYKTKKGINAEIVEEISKINHKRIMLRCYVVVYVVI